MKDQGAQNEGHAALKDQGRPNLKDQGGPDLKDQGAQNEGPGRGRQIKREK